MINWQINAYDLLAIIGAALLLYGRIVAIETKLAPMWEAWVSAKRQQGQGGR